jgi:hypothetical protein
MTPEAAKNIVEQLAHGIDPETGELLNAPGVLSSPQVIRALFVAARALQSIQAEDATPEKERQSAGKPWTPGEDMALAAALDAGKSVQEIAQLHGRSPGGIAARMVKLGIISERKEAYAFGRSLHQKARYNTAGNNGEA